MKRVSICIATCNRNEMLRRCLLSISQAELSDKYEYFVVVVDNNDQPVSEEIVNYFKGSMECVYDWEGIPGIPFARNRALKNALELGADFIAFIDDDEWVEPSWLINMVASIDKEGVDVVSGGVNQERDGKIYRKRYFERIEPRYIAETDNVIFKKWLAKKLAFDEDFAQTGGSDAMFFRRAIELGARIESCPTAVVTEEMPVLRQGMAWRLQRHFRYGLTHCMIERKLEYGASSLFLFCRAVSLLPIGLGESLVKLFIKGPEEAKEGVDRMMRGVGSLSYFLGIRYNEYKR
ncbi:glycosyltransferase family A protein [Marinobacter sp. chi1]|uniref:Glycosyltransferase family A protein n=1 Tax=Marinobacter suaedae TaxID=3057675 RepID=A0ABT8VWD5_9GAMM|nr:glycosyltransferase family A protein [Marinobacter sp. chi1]MDO3720305.1 glycosyltransferase family A protein [Marinobacter sp. chi1]